MNARIFSQEVIASLKAGKIGVIPTDTLYGVVGSALSPKTVERIYAARVREKNKPCIVLIADISELEKFGIEPSQVEQEFLARYWPGKISVVFSCLGEKWQYLHRDTETLAFRVPDIPELRDLLRQTGPLVAPSANPQGMQPAGTIAEAKEYFSTQVNFYVDGGLLLSKPSTLVTFENGQPIVLRRGAAKILQTV